MAKSSPEGGGEEQLGVRLHARLQMFVRRTLLDRRAATDRGQLRLRRLEGRAGREHAEDGDAGTRTRRLVQHLGPQWHPHVVRDRELETFAHHADDRHVIVTKLHAAAEHRWIAAEARAPHLVADHGDRWRRGLLVGLDQDAAHERRRAGNAEAGCGDLRDRDGTRIAAGGGAPGARTLRAGVQDDQVARDVAPGPKLRHRPQRVAPDDEVVQRARLVVVGRNVPVEDLDDAIARGQRQCGRQDQRQHLEDDRADADRERHGQPADNSEAGVLHEHPAAKLEVE